MLAEPAVRVYCLGHFRIERADGDSPVQRAQLKPLALLKVLIALGGGHVPQDRIRDALWPDLDGDAAHAAFTSTLYRLRQLLGPDALVLRNRQLSVDYEHVWTDVHAFESLLGALEVAGEITSATARQRAERLIALYRGPFLSGESEPPDVVSARERLQSRWLRAVRELGANLEREENREAAVDLYGRAMEIEPCAEDLCQNLMIALRDAGRTSEVSTVYQRLRRNLEAQGGAVPSGRTESIRIEIERGANHAPTSAGDTAGAVVMATTGQVPGASTECGALPKELEQLALPEYPSIVVLPFTSMNGGPEQEYFADGLTDTLITDLSRLHKILVIARNSAFAYKGRAVDVRQIGKELGVRHVLEGGVQSSGNHMRVNVQLVETTTGKHVWAERYDRAFDDVLLIQDEIATRVIEELDVSLVTGEQSRTWRRMTKNPAAYSASLAGRAIQRSDHSIDGMLRSRTHFRRAIELDPEFALPYAYMVSIYLHLTDNGYDVESDVCYETAVRFADRAVQLGPDLPIARAYRACILQQVDRHEEAAQDFRLAVQMGPNAAESLMLSAWGLAQVGDANESLPLALRAMRLDPVPPGWYWGGLADIYLRLHRWEDAIPVFERSLAESRDLVWSWVGLIVACARAGRLDEARRAAAEWRRINPRADANDNFYLLAWSDPDFRAILAQSLREAGL